MADEDPLADLEKEVLRGVDRKTKRQLRKLPPASSEELLELRGSTPNVDTFDSDQDDLDEVYQDWEDEVAELRYRKLERWFAIAGLAASLLLLYSLWMVSLGGGSRFRFTLTNSLPAILFAGMLIGHCLNDVTTWVRFQAYQLGQYWQDHGPWQRLTSWRNRPEWVHAYCVCRKCKRGIALHNNPCRCVVCKFKRRWRSWRTLHRYRGTEGHWHRDNQSGIEYRTPNTRRRKRRDQH